MTNSRAITFGDKWNMFWAGTVIPTERAFKGYSILFSIWTVGTFLAITMIHTLTKAHTNADVGASDNTTILNNLDDLTWIMVIVGGVFAALAFISFLLRIKYRGVEGKSAEDVEDDLQRMVRERSRLTENN